jgi:hypothetical protein
MLAISPEHPLLWGSAILQAVPPTLLVLAVFWLARSLAPDRPAVAWAAGWIAALFPSHLYPVALSPWAPWAALLLTLLVAVVVAPQWRGTWRGAIVAGALAGVLLLIEPVLVLAVPFCAGIFFWSDMTTAGRWPTFGSLARIASLAGVAFLVMAPGLIHHDRLQGRWTLSKPAFADIFDGVNSPRDAGREWTLKSTAQAVRSFLLFDDSSPQTAGRVYRISAVARLLLSLLGVWLSRDRLGLLWPTYAIFAAVLGYHVLVAPSTLLRVPVEPLSFVWAAFAVVRLTIDFAQAPPVRVYRPGERSGQVASAEHALKGPHYKKLAAKSRLSRRR